MKQIYCTSINCSSRRSICCDAKSKVFNGEEGTSYFKCSTCGGEFIPREHSCTIAYDIGSLIMHCGNVYNEQGIDISKEVGTYIHALRTNKSV